jgi:hypothetical protein
MNLGPSLPFQIVLILGAFGACVHVELQAGAAMTGANAAMRTEQSRKILAFDRHFPAAAEVAMSRVYVLTRQFTIASTISS